MRNIRNGRLAAVVAFALVATVGACNRASDDAVVATDTAMVTVPAATALRVDEIEIGKTLDADKSIGNETDNFGVRDTIYVAVETEGAGSGTLAARFTFQDGQVVEEASQSIAPTSEAWHEFHIQKATAWPTGNYKVEVMLDGVSAGSKDFSVR
ncbi:MAG: hypothetical protein ACR2GK_08155 [Gemmatimonadaceae bacterium]